MKIYIDVNESLQKLIKEAMSDSIAEWGEGGIYVTLDKCDRGVKVSSDGKNVTLCYSDLTSLLKGIGIIISKGESRYETEQELKYRQLGNMIDVSRNGVMKVSTVKKFIRMSALMGFNALNLYTEDTYEIEDEPYFGHLRGRYTVDELKEIDSYAEKFGIEVIPCIQTLAHLNAIFNWPEYFPCKDIEDILNVGLEKSYELIEKMFQTMKKAFKSKQIHIGMDEAHFLGRGAYIDMFGYEKCSEIMKRHLARVIELCRKYDYTPLMWSDMFFRVCSSKRYYSPVVQLTEDVLRSVPEEVNLVFWDYYRPNAKYYDDMLTLHEKFNRKVSFYGGGATWYGFMPMQKFALTNMRAAFEALKKHEVDVVFNTLWGDHGNECSTFAGLPSIALFSTGAWTGDLSDEAISEIMSIFGANFDDFMSLSMFHRVEMCGAENVVVHEYMLYSDVLQGAFDSNIPDGMSEYFRDIGKRMRENSNKNPKWAYIFESLEKLAAVLELKAECGKDIKRAYDEKNREKLEYIANEHICTLIDAVKEFRYYLRKRWYVDNKPFGFEVQDQRLGGLVGRLEDASLCINEYLSGELDCIDELECERLPYIKDTENNIVNILQSRRWVNIVTFGRL